MKKNRIFNQFDSFFSLIYYLAKMNLCFWVYTVRGGVLLGFAPAAVALIEVSSYKDINETRVNIRKTYHEKYKQAFHKANKIGVLLILSALIFYLNFLAMISNSASYSLINVFAFFITLVCYLSVVIWIFPILSKRDISIIESLKYSLILGISYLHYTVFLIILLFSFLYLSLTYPALLLFFFYSSFSLIIVSVTKKPIETIFN